MNDTKQVSIVPVYVAPPPVQQTTVGVDRGGSDW